MSEATLTIFSDNIQWWGRMPPTLPFESPFNSSVSSLTTGTTSAGDCRPSAAADVILGVLSTLLAVSEYLSLSKKASASGILDALLIALGLRRRRQSPQQPQEGGETQSTTGGGESSSQQGV